MKKFITIIGPQDSGKSTIIKSLTGCKTASWQNYVTDNSNQKCIYVICSSPQEGDKPVSITVFQQIISDVINNSNCLGLVMALQPSRPRNRDSMEDFFTEINNTNAFEKFAFILNPIRNGNNQDIQSIINSLTPFSSTFVQLDARRFSYMCASTIQQISGILG